MMSERELLALQARVLAQERLLKQVMPALIALIKKLNLKAQEFEVIKAEVALLKDAVDRLDDFRGGPDQIPGIAA